MRKYVRAGLLVAVLTLVACTGSNKAVPNSLAQTSPPGDAISGPAADGSGAVTSTDVTATPASPAPAAAGTPTAKATGTPKPGTKSSSGSTSTTSQGGGEAGTVGNEVVTSGDGGTIQIVPDTSASFGSGGSTPGPKPTPTAPAKITNLQMATSRDANGDPVNPKTTFNSATDTTIICFVSLINTQAGTTLNWAQVYQDTNIAKQGNTVTFKQPLEHFYVQFTAPAGKTLTPGRYRLVFSVNSQPAVSITYTIT